MNHYQKQALPANANINKQAVANAFAKAVNSYDHFASFQRDVGQHLLSLLAEPSLGKVLDLGCGTGHFSSILAQKSDVILALDLAPAMARRAASHHQKILPLVGDADHLPLRDNSITTVFSSLVLQWCDELSKPLTELKRVASKQVVIATLLQGSLRELASSWQVVDGKPHVNRFLSKAQVELALGQAGIAHYHLEIKTHRLYFSDPRSVLSELKGIGANHLHSADAKEKGLAGVKLLKAMFTQYEQLRTEQGIPVTYQVCYLSFNTDKKNELNQ